jgi:hypothetical protein
VTMERAEERKSDKGFRSPLRPNRCSSALEAAKEGKGRGGGK